MMTSLQIFIEDLEIFIEIYHSSEKPLYNILYIHRF